MKFKTVLIWLGKAFLAGCAAFMLLTAFCFFYYNVPTHYPCEDGASDYKWKPNVFYSRGTEGFAWGKINNDGYVNAFDYSEGMEINTLIMGSSQMEAFQVAMDESAAGRLNDMLDNKTVYNIGVSAHPFLTCCCNMDAAINKYHPTDYLVIETSKIDFSEEELISAANGTIAEIPSHSGGILEVLSGNQFLRLAKTQLTGFMDRSANSQVQSAASNTPSDEVFKTEQYAEKLNTLLEKLSERCKTANCNLIILYQPFLSIGANNSLIFENNNDELRALFSGLCEENNIIFLDMTDRFIREYEAVHILPHGFGNSSVGNGHLNKYGHGMIADELSKIIAD